MATYRKCGTVKINNINKMIYMKVTNLYVTCNGKNWILLNIFILLFIRIGNYNQKFKE